MREIVLEVKPRTVFGSRAARRLRSQGLLPGNIYGHGEPCLPIVLELKSLRSFLDDGHRVVTLRIDGSTERGLLKEVQYGAYGDDFLHVDFTRLAKGEKIKVEVAVETVGVPRALSAGGVLQFILHEIRVVGPADLVPERFLVNVENLKIGDSIRVRDIALPPECAFDGDVELVVVMVSAAVAEKVVPAVDAPATVEPELIRRKKEEAGEEADAK